MCFVLGPTRSLVVALFTANERLCPEMKYFTICRLSLRERPFEYDILANSFGISGVI